MPKPGSTTARGYGSQHQAQRRRYAPLVAAGGAICARCQLVIKPDEPWDLDHAPNRQGYLGPSHRRCNRAEGARTRNRHRLNTSRDW